MIDGIIYKKDFFLLSKDLFNFLEQNVNWDARMTVRKTASYGVAYNYSQMSYPFQEMLPALEKICDDLNTAIGFKPNNCLINYYANGSSKMGFHSDQTDILEQGTGVAIISLGAVRTLRFRNIDNQQNMVNFQLDSGSLLYMTQDVQNKWQHAIPKSDDDQPRISLTLRKIITD
jgi:alkylated DNA repair dioxygenase AlkB